MQKTEEKPQKNTDFPQDALCVSRLDEYALIAVEGLDSSKFLQGQLTCNLNEITESQTRPGAHCTHKGRMIASFRLARLGEHACYLRTHRSTADALLKSLGKYIVFSKAKLRDASADFQLLGISGAGAEDLVRQVFGSVPARCHDIVHADCGHVIRVTDTPRFECWIPQAAADDTLARLSPHGDCQPCTDWQALDIRDGLGEVRGETIEAFTPQMLNLQLVDAISFNKGCYTGQEIVARTQYRGMLKKAMYRIGGEGQPPAPATSLWHAGEAQPRGEVVMAAATKPGHWEALAVLHHDDFAKPLTIRQSDGAESSPLVALPLPYAIPSEDNKT